MITNLILIAAILIGLGLFIRQYLKNLEQLDEDGFFDEIEEQDLNIEFFVKETANAFSKSLKQNLDDANLSKDELFKRRQRQSTLKKSLNSAAYGDSKAKTNIKSSIRSLLLEEKYGLDGREINRLIPFNAPDKIKSGDKFEILLYFYNKACTEKETENIHYDGFDEMVKEYNLIKPVQKDDGDYYIVTSERIEEVYEDAIVKGNSDFLGKVNIEWNDKLEIVAQKIFEKYIGLGPVDMLLETGIDGLNAGTSGVPKGAFTVKSENKDTPFSYESVWVVYHGIKLHLKCCSFETQEELIRVTSNVYKYEAPYVMSKSKGFVVSTMIDGSRIVAVRPPFADSFAFFLRKFDSTPSVEPEKLIKEANKLIPILMMKWLIRGRRNIGITGSQGTGKTTMLKSMIRFIDPALTLRIQELQFELNLRYAYPERNVVTFQETASISAQEGLNLQKKTDGDVNLIGEVANAIQASHIIQTAMVASLFAMFTHHAKTSHDLVEAIANNLLEIGLYKEKSDAVAMSAKILNVDMHVTNVKGDRHIERITEIIPVANRAYPSDRIVAALDLDAYFDAIDKHSNMTVEEYEMALFKYQLMENMDATEYYRRSTDPELFETRDIIAYVPILDESGNKVGGTFKLVNMPSDAMIKDITDVLSVAEEREFWKDMETIKTLSAEVV